MNKGYLLIDGNSVGHFANNTKVLTIGSMQVQAIFGFLRMVRSVVAIYPMLTPIVLWDGASWRKMAFAAYKENRDKADTKHEQALLEAKAHYKKQSKYIEGAIKLLGMAQVRAFNMEADDLAAIMADRYVAQGHRVVLLTGDKDWIQLVGPSVIWRNVDQKHVRKTVTASTFEDHTGVKSIDQFVEVKALCGDTGDNVPGVGGIGEKGAIEFVNTYGSVASFTNQVVVDKSIDLKKVPKKFRALIEDENKIFAFRRNLDLVDLRTTARPAPINLRVTKGEADAEKFRALCDLLLFKSITSDLDDWLFPFSAFQQQAKAA